VGWGDGGLGVMVVAELGYWGAWMMSTGRTRRRAEEEAEEESMRKEMIRIREH
jgi:hypothetical protein